MREKRTHLGDRSQVALEELLGEVLLGAPDALDVLVEPVLAALRVRHAALGVGIDVAADAVLGRDDEVLGVERGDEDDAAVRLGRELVRAGRVLRDRVPLRARGPCQLLSNKRV